MGRIAFKKSNQSVQNHAKPVGTRSSDKHSFGNIFAYEVRSYHVDAWSKGMSQEWENTFFLHQTYPDAEDDMGRWHWQSFRTNSADWLENCTELIGVARTHHNVLQKTLEKKTNIYTSTVKGVLINHPLSKKSITTPDIFKAWTFGILRLRPWSSTVGLVYSKPPGGQKNNNHMPECVSMRVIRVSLWFTRVAQTPPLLTCRVVFVPWGCVSFPCRKRPIPSFFYKCQTQRSWLRTIYFLDPWFETEKDRTIILVAHNDC